MFFYPDRDKVVEMSGQSSRTTHGALECLEACRLLGAILCTALSGAEKQNILKEHGEESFQSERILSIARGDYLAKKRKQVRGTGYVVECLEALCGASTKAKTLKTPSSRRPTWVTTRGYDRGGMRPTGRSLLRRRGHTVQMA